ncbi:MAG: anthranilate synthase component I, partial [Sphaerochaeta sp.]
MQYNLQMEEVKELAKQAQGNLIPLTTELFSDKLTPLSVLERMKNTGSHCFLLESVEACQRWGRYTFLGYDPTLKVTCTDHLLTITDSIGNVQKQKANPQEFIRSLLSNYRSIPLSNLPPFTGGLVGYFSYDYIKYSEPTLNLDAQDIEQFNDVDLMLFETVICFDNYRQKIILI